MTDLVTVEFSPTAAMRRLKATFWASFEGEADSITAKLVTEVTDNTSVTRWWSVEGFKTWFLAKNEHEARHQYLHSLALDALEEILLSDDARLQSARVAAAKTVAELANKFPAKNAAPKYLDEDVQNMNQAQLKLYIQKNKHVLRVLGTEDSPRSPGGDKEDENAGKNKTEITEQPISSAEKG